LHVLQLQPQQPDARKITTRKIISQTIFHCSFVEQLDISLEKPHFFDHHQTFIHKTCG